MHGTLTVHERENEYEIGYCFHSNDHGKGYASESIFAILDVLKDKGAVNITTGTAQNNTPTVRLLSSLGFRKTGTEEVSFYKDADGNNITFEGGTYELLLLEETTSNLRGRYMEISLLSDRYLVRRMTEDDIAEIYALCRNNTLYYYYCPPFVTEGSIENDMKALPPNKEYSDKYYLGYYDGEKLIAVMDLILSFPYKDTAFIGFFMTDTSVQNAGIGSGIIDTLRSCLKNHGFSRIRLGWVKGNPQAEHFWKKNLFIEIGAAYDTDDYTVVIAQRII